MAKEGYTVYGTSRSANYETADLGGAVCTMIPMTLEDEDTIKTAVDYIVKRHGRIDNSSQQCGKRNSGRCRGNDGRRGKASV